MSKEVPRTTVRAVKLGPQHGAQVANRDLHRVGRRALGLSADVVAWPRKHDGDGGIDARRCEDCPKIRDAGTFAREEYYVSDDCKRR